MKKIIKLLLPLIMLIAVALPLSSCKSGTALESPTGFELDENYNITWTPVENARSYAIEIQRIDGDRTEATSRREAYALSSLEMGDYDIRVKAVGDGTHFTDSDWSAVVSLFRAYESGCQYQLINNDTEYELAAVAINTTSLELEDTYRGKPVTSVGRFAFRKASKIEELTLGKNVTNICDSAFYNCLNLKTITMPDAVNFIGEAAFQSCGALTNFTMPSAVTKIEKSTFAYCYSLKEVDFNNVTEIGEQAFDHCTGFEQLDFTDSKIKSIGQSAFQASTALTELTLGDALEIIGNSAFMQCSSLDTIHFSEKNTLKEIQDNAFRLCGFTTFDFPEGLEYIGAASFLLNKDLETVTIPDSVTRVGASAFYGTEIYNAALLNNENLVYADKWLVSYIPRNGEVLRLLNPYINYKEDDLWEGDYIVKKGIIGIADNMFNNTKITQVTLPSDIKYSGNYTFANCEELTEFNASINSSLEHLGVGVFYKCTNLESVSFDTERTSKLKIIDDYAFYECTSFDYNADAGAAFIPPSVERIGTYAFYKTELYQDKNADEYGVIYVDDWAIACLGTQPYTGDLDVVITDPDAKAVIKLKAGTRGIGDYAFYNCLALEDLQIESTEANPTKITHIGIGAFYNCKKLKSFTFDNSIRSIADYAFYNCKNLTANFLPRELRTIGRSAFYGCSALTTVNFESTKLEKIGDFSYYGCSKLKNLIFREEDDLSEIGAYAFFGCDSLENVTIPANIKKIGESAFSNCKNLEALTLEDGVEEIGDYAFRSNESLQEIVLPDSVKKVGDSAFLQCFNVRSIDLGGVEEIGDYAFAENFGVSNLMIPASVKRIGKGAFYYLGADCTDENGASLLSASSVIIRGSIDKIDVNAFYGCDGTTFYIADTNRDGDWGVGWNSSRRPVVWNVTLDDSGYVKSVTVTKNTFEYYDGINVLRAPFRAGYRFAGWSLEAGSSQIAYTEQNVAAAPEGTVLYAVYIQ